MTESPWAWRPDVGAWAAALIKRSDRWEPVRTLKLDAERIRAVIVHRALAASAWLRHPFVSPLIKPKPEDSYRDVALAAWASAGTAADLGTVELAEQIMLWASAGDLMIDADRRESKTLGALIAQPAQVPVALDLWCQAAGVATPGSWPAVPSSAIVEREPEIEAPVGRYLRTMAMLANRCPTP